MSEFSVWKVRQEFPMLHRTMHGKPFIYLDTAATAHKPLTVIDALCSFYKEKYATVHRSLYDFASQATAQYDAVRRQVKAFLGAHFAEEIIFTRGTTDGINLVASSFGKAFIQKGDEICISVMEHHSNIVPWQLLAQERGAQLKVIPINAKGELCLDTYKTVLSKRTKIVSIAHISNVTGTINPLKEIIALAHAHGAKVLVDGAQAAPHMPVDVQELGADFYVFSGHKAYGPTGIGVLYGKRALLERMPPYQSGGDMIDEVSIGFSTFQPSPLKFEAGTPMIAEVMGLGEALTFIEDIGRARIAAWEGELLDYATKRLLEIKPLRIIGTSENKGAILSFTIDGVHPLDIGTLLDIRGIAIRTGQLCAQPTLRCFNLSSISRISFGIYNTFEEIDRCIEALKESILLLQPSLSY